MPYIFLYIDSTQGEWRRGMGNKSDKVGPSLCLSLSRFYSLCSRWLRLPFAFFHSTPFFLCVSCLNYYSVLSAFLLHSVGLIQATLAEHAGRLT